MNLILKPPGIALKGPHAASRLYGCDCEPPSPVGVPLQEFGAVRERQCCRNSRRVILVACMLVCVHAGMREHACTKHARTHARIHLCMHACMHVCSFEKFEDSKMTFTNGQVHHAHCAPMHDMPVQAHSWLVSLPTGVRLPVCLLTCLPARLLARTPACACLCMYTTASLYTCASLQLESNSKMPAPAVHAWLCTYVCASAHAHI